MLADRRNGNPIFYGKNVVSEFSGLIGLGITWPFTRWLSTYI